MTEDQLSQRDAIQQALNDPNVQKYLGMLRQAEGTAQYADPYRVAGGGSVTLPDLSQYRRIPWNFTDKSGKKDKSTAAGAYQFINDTWNGAASALGLGDFSPRSQDMAAVWLLQKNGSLADVMAGDFQSAVQKDNKTWASLPGSPYNQRTRLPEQISSALGAPGAVAMPELPTNMVQLTPDTVAQGTGKHEVDQLLRISNAPGIPDPMKIRLAQTQEAINVAEPELARADNLLGLDDDLPKMFDADLRRVLEAA